VSGENYKMRSLTIKELNDPYSSQCCSCDQIEKNVMGGACSRYGRKEM